MLKDGIMIMCISYFITNT